MPLVQSKILGPDGRPFVRQQRDRVLMRRPIRSTYDAAVSNDDTRRHWANSDALSARSANSTDVRTRLRNRSRYERANNSYCSGMVLTLANDLIGTGPRLQLQTEAAETNRKVERAFGEWAKAIHLADKLRTMKQAKTVDGEAFALLTTNDSLPTSVKLDVRLIEAEMVADPWSMAPPDTTDVAEGIRFDSDGNPVAYHILDEHPGDTFTFGSAGKWTAARSVIHWFRADRPGQIRGIPEITPALPLFAQLRRYTLAVIAAAETAADFAVLLESTMPPDTSDEEITAFDTQEIEHRLMTALPTGYKASQLKAEQPAQSYEMFKHEILNEIARCLNMPFNVAAGNSASYNYASGRLDHQVYHRSIYVERADNELVVLARVLGAFLEEAVNVPELLPSDLSIVDLLYRWYWDGFQHVDPVKEATANQILLDKNMTTLAAIYAEDGEDWEPALRQRAKEKQLERELKVEPAVKGAAPPADQPAEEDMPMPSRNGRALYHG